MVNEIRLWTCLCLRHGIEQPLLLLIELLIFLLVPYVVYVLPDLGLGPTGHLSFKLLKIKAKLLNRTDQLLHFLRAPLLVYDLSASKTNLYYLFLKEFMGVFP